MEDQLQIEQEIKELRLLLELMQEQKQHWTDEYTKRNSPHAKRLIDITDESIEEARAWLLYYIRAKHGYIIEAV